jgi:hypothetical protein
VAFLERRAPNRVPSNLAANAAKMQQKCSKNAAQKVMQLALVAYGRIAHARNKAEGLRRQYLNVPSPLFFSNMT